MSKHFFVRPVRQTDTDVFIDWSKNTPNNLWDPEVVNYKSTYVRCVYGVDGPVLYTAIQRPMMIESLAFSPTSNPGERAIAMKELVQDTVSQAHLQGAGEIYFYCKDESTAAFAQNQLFEEVPFKMYRVKLSKLEKHEDKT